MQSNNIVIKGARQHNLKNIDIKFPRNKFIVITGLSGSGKSTIAFDTLYAEGQRRYVESLSTYARQFLGQMDKPDVDMIEGLSPAIAIEQKTASHNPRSTVGTVTEIYDFLRLLYARIGTPHCHKCGKEITSQSLDQIIDKVLSLPQGSKIIILAPLVINKKGTHDNLFKQLKKDGFTRVKINNKILDIDEINEISPLAKNKKHSIDVVIDRLILKDGIDNRLADSLELALSMSDGTVSVDVLGQKIILFSEKAACIKCGISYPEFTPASFSFNSPHGACTKCDGLGFSTKFDTNLIVPNDQLSLREGAIVLWADRSSVQFAEFLDAITSYYKTDIYTPFKDLPPKLVKTLFYGSGTVKIPFYFEQEDKKIVYKKTYEGIIPSLEKKYKETNAGQAKEEIKQFMNYVPCSFCNGSRLNNAGKNVSINGFTIHQITSMSIDKCLLHIKNLKLAGKKKIIADNIIKEISERLNFLENVGLSYLTLNRAASTLSGGESQRIRLATQIGSKLTGVLYVLDEPSIGLHQRDNQRLLATLLKMRDLGNTVLVVEHDEETILTCDHVIDMGPAAGIHGGEVMFSGTPADLLKDEKSLTALYLSGKKKIEIPTQRRKGNGNNLVIEGASSNNLQNIDVAIPLGCFTCVTGVSGSGKSTLITGTIHPLLSQRLFNARIPAGTHKAVHGLKYLDKVVNVDQSPIGRTPRSNPATYTGLFSFIRELFAQTKEARTRGYKAGRFSFNIKGGRCEACSGDGVVKIEMREIILPPLSK